MEDLTRLELFALRCWHQSPLWVRDAAPLPVVEWVERRDEHLIDGVIAVAIAGIDAIGQAMERMAEAIAPACAAFCALGEALDGIEATGER